MLCAEIRQIMYIPKTLVLLYKRGDEMGQIIISGVQYARVRSDMTRIGISWGLQM